MCFGYGFMWCCLGWWVWRKVQTLLVIHANLKQDNYVPAHGSNSTILCTPSENIASTSSMVGVALADTDTDAPAADVHQGSNPSGCSVCCYELSYWVASSDNMLCSTYASKSSNSNHISSMANLSSRKKILDNVTAIFRPNRVTALMVSCHWSSV